MKLLSVDPGKRTGWAVWNFGSGQPELLTMGVSKDVEEFYDVLSHIQTDQIVYENYHVRPQGMNKGWAHEWNRPPASLVIGALEFYSRANEIKIAVQQASQLPVGCGYIGYPYRKGIHVPNNVSAIAHGAYWLVKNKFANSRGFSISVPQQAHN